MTVELDADIEKSGGCGGGGGCGSGVGAEGMADGIRMKIKRKNGGKVKHEVVMTSGKKKKTVGTMTEPELFGPCEPGTSVTLDGVVWQETDGGVLVVNVTWREKSYVGTLLDCTRHDWAPPRLCDESHGGDNALPAPCDPKRATHAHAHGKRSLKVRPKSAAQRRTANSGFAVPHSSPGKPHSQPRPALIQCPEPNCNKKYKHINGLKYHQTHAHSERQSQAAATAPSPAVTPQPEPPAEPAAGSDQSPPPQPQSLPEQQLPLPPQPQSQPQPQPLPSPPAAEPMDESKPPLPPPPPACPSSPAYSDISDANEESEEQGAESPDDLPDAAPLPGAATGTEDAAPPPPVAAGATPASGPASAAAAQQSQFSSFAFHPNFRSRDERADAPDPLSFPYQYSYPAFSLPASPAAGAQNGERDDGVCATMETTGPPPAPTSSYFLHPLSFPHPVFRMAGTMFPDKPDPADPPVRAPGALLPQETAGEPPTQRHLHTHHHTHVGVPFAPFPIAAFPLLSNPTPFPGPQ